MTLSGRGSIARPAMLSVGCMITGLVLTGCASVLQGSPSTSGGNGGPSSYDHPTGPQDIIVSINDSGGFVPVEVKLRNTPKFLLLGDGRAVVAGAMIEIYPGPAIRPLQSSTLTEDQIQELLAAADDAALLAGDIDYGEPAVTDLNTTTVRVTVGGTTAVQSAYALGFEDDTIAGLDDAQRAARGALSEFTDLAQSMVGEASQGYQPTGVVAYRLGGEASPRPDQPELEQPPLTWPLSTAPDPPAGTDVASCLVVTGSDVPVLLETLSTANELTPWMIGTDPPARMVFRPLLPGDPGCE